MDQHPEQDGFADQQESGLDKMAYDEIIDAIRQFTPVYRTVFNLFVIEGLSHDEIARSLRNKCGCFKIEFIESQKQPEKNYYRTKRNKNICLIQVTITGSSN